MDSSISRSSDRIRIIQNDISNIKDTMKGNIQKAVGDQPDPVALQSKVAQWDPSAFKKRREPGYKNCCNMKLVMAVLAIIGLVALALGITAFIVWPILPLAISLTVVGGSLLLVDAALLIKKCRDHHNKRSTGYSEIEVE